MELTYANGRLTGYVPGFHGVRTVDVRQVATLRTDGHLAHSRWRHQRLNHFVRSSDIQCISNPKEQWRSGIDSDECGISFARKIANPDDQYIRTDHARRPGITKSPGRTGLPRDRPAAS